MTWNVQPSRSPVAAVLLALAGACSAWPDAAPSEVITPPEEVSAAAQPLNGPQSYTLFESGHVRPLAISTDGSLLYATNTPDSRLEIFQINAQGLNHVASVPVGIDPVAVAARSATEVWVVNHVSDSVSVVTHDGTGDHARVTRTLLVGDEPRDIIFAGPGRSRAFVTCAHRGQNNPNDPQLSTPGIGRADVWVFDSGDLGTSLGGDPLTILTLFTDTPRALAATPDGSHVYAAGFHTGNRTATISEVTLPDGGPLTGGVPGPLTNYQGAPRPEVGLLVKHDGQHWRDVLGRNQDIFMRFTLPDKDVFVIDAMANPPAQVSGAAGFFSGVGTILFNMAVNPVNGAVYVSNTDANNMTRFTGPGIFGGSTVRGHLAESRITVLKPGQVLPRHLNKHINYASCCAPIGNAESQKSLASPQMMEVTSDGATLYVAAHGSSKIGVFDTAELEADTFVPSAASQITVSGGGPTGLALDETNDRLYVLTHFNNAIAIVDTVSGTEVGQVPMHNPEPAYIVQGRPFLYDAAFTSSHGDSSCASCHVFGDLDSLAWDLGDPDAPVAPNDNPWKTVTGLTSMPPGFDSFHPMKGPMITQSLRGLDNHGPMHWRGDKTGAYSAPSAQPNSGAFDEHAAFMQFNGAFEGVIGRHAPLSLADMDAFAQFALAIVYPPNPIRDLDNSLTPEQQAGLDFFNNFPSSSQGTCAHCHVLDLDANSGIARRPGFIGTDGLSAFPPFTQPMKIPHMRNIYQHVGRFGHPPDAIFDPVGTPHMGDQIRGFGILHDGSVDTVLRFVSAATYPPGQQGDLLKAAVTSFMFAADSNMAPIVGQQITLSASTAAVSGPRIDLLIARASVGECDLIAKTIVDGLEVGYLHIGSGTFISSRAADPSITDAALRAATLAAGREITYTCTPPGSGLRMGIDRDLDGFRDGDELDAGSDPADPTSTPSTG